MGDTQDLKQTIPMNFSLISAEGLNSRLRYRVELNMYLSETTGSDS